MNNLNKNINQTSQSKQTDEIGQIDCLVRLDGVTGEWQPQGCLHFKLKDCITSIYYFNRNPHDAIEINFGLFYKHHKLPAYMIQRKSFPNNFYVGTYEEIKKIIEEEA